MNHWTDGGCLVVVLIWSAIELMLALLYQGYGNISRLNLQFSLVVVFRRLGYNVNVTALLLERFSLCHKC